MDLSSITLGDIIGYLLTFVIGVISGILGDKFFIKHTENIKQNKNTVFNGDITGGDKIEKKD